MVLKNDSRLHLPNKTRERHTDGFYFKPEEDFVADHNAGGLQEAVQRSDTSGIGAKNTGSSQPTPKSH